MLCLYCFKSYDSLFIFIATALWFTERNIDNEYNSIPDCFFIAVLMLTGQGIPEASNIYIDKF